MLIDTETTGLAAPIMVVELAAQHMRGWLPAAEPFRHLLNHSVEVAPPGARLYGYTREILKRDGACALAIVRVEAGVIVQRAFHYIRAAHTMRPAVTACARRRPPAAFASHPACWPHPLPPQFHPLSRQRMPHATPGCLR